MGAKRSDSARRERKLWRELVHRSMFAHESVQNSSRRAPSKKVGKESRVVPSRQERLAMDGRNCRLRRRKIGGAYLHGGGAQRESCRYSSSVRDSSRRDHRNADGVDDLRQERKHPTTRAIPRRTLTRTVDISSTSRRFRPRCSDRLIIGPLPVSRSSRPDGPCPRRKSFAPIKKKEHLPRFGRCWVAPGCRKGCV